MCYAVPILPSVAEMREYLDNDMPADAFRGEAVTQPPQSFADFVTQNKENIQLQNPYWYRHNKGFVESALNAPELSILSEAELNNKYLSLLDAKNGGHLPVDYTTLNAIKDDIALGEYELAQSKIYRLQTAVDRHKARTTEQAETIRNAWKERQESIALQNSPIIDWLNKRVAYNKDLYAKDLGVIANKMSTEEHVKQLAGGDLTKGSCSSLAYAYAGRTFGLDVLDFRGGESLRFFSESGHVAQITKEAGGKIVKHKNDFVASHQLFNDVVEGKQYYFSTARHAAIIRRTSQGIQYLELQSPMPQYNGFFPLDDRVLRYRFGAKKAHTFHGMKFESESYLVDIDNFKDKAWFKDMLRYINTDANKQMKSAAGSIK